MSDETQEPPTLGHLIQGAMQEYIQGLEEVILDLVNYGDMNALDIADRTGLGIDRSKEIYKLVKVLLEEREAKNDK